MINPVPSAFDERYSNPIPGEMQLNEERTTPVAVKILKSDASSETRDDFRREVKIMSSFDHENILKLIGVVPTS